MKKIIFLLLLLVICISAQNRFSIGTTYHAVIPYHASDRLGFGATIDVGYLLFSNFEATFSTGYFAWGNNVQNNHAIRISPDIFGFKYYFLDYNKNLKFYALGQFQKLTGNYYKDIYYFDEGLDENVYSHTETDKLSELGTVFGLGTVISLDDNLAIDLNSQIRLFYNNPHFKTISISTGLKYSW